MSGCYTCGGGMGKHDPVAHDQVQEADEPCITDWLCLPGAHLRFGECVESTPQGCTCENPDGPTVCGWCRGRV